MKKIHCYTLLCILWMLVIFWFSAQVADDSQEMSDVFVRLLDALFSLDIMKNEIIRDMTSFLVRKAAHMSEYAVLAILLGLTIRGYKKEPWLLLALAATAAYAATDEFHQLFVEGRSARIFDVTVDFVGGVIGISFVQLILKIRQIKSRR